MESQMDRLKKIGALAPYILLYGAAFFIVGLFNILSAQYVTDIWTDAAFWNRFLSQSIANLLVFSGTVMLYLERKDENEEYKQLHQTVETSAKADLQTDFGEWIVKENKKKN